MSEAEVKLRGYIIQVAIMEIPLIKLLTGLITQCGNQIPEDTTLGGLINFYINQIPDLAEKAKDDTQENYDKIYDEFVNILNAEVEPIIEAETNAKADVDIVIPTE